MKSLVTASKKIIKAVVFGIVIPIIGLIIAHPLWFPLIFNYLDIHQPPHQADAIIVLAGDTGMRLQYASELYHEGYSETILLSSHWNHTRKYLNILSQYDVDREHIIINDQATSTFDEAEQVIQLLADSNLKSVMIVTDNFHSRRALATYEQMADDAPIDFSVVSPDVGINATSWWHSNQRIYVASELLKIPYYFVKYGINAF